MRLPLILVAVAAVTFEIVAKGTPIRPPIGFSIGIGFVLVWCAVFWTGKRNAVTHPWITGATGLLTVAGPLRWILLDWCLLIERCVA